MSIMHGKISSSSTNGIHATDAPSADVSPLVLLVDDSQVDRLAVRRLLRRWEPIRVREAASLQEARAVVQEETPSWMLLDNALPDGSAAELLDQLRSTDDGPGLPGSLPCPIIILTASGNERLAADLVRRGAGDYLSKASIVVAEPDAVEAADELLRRSLERATEHHRLMRRAARLRDRAIRKRRHERQARDAAEEQRKRAEEALEATRQHAASAERANRHLAIALEGGGLDTWEWSPLGNGDGGTASPASRRLVSILNLPEDQAEVPWIELVHEDDADAVRTSLREMRPSIGETVRVEARFRSCSEVGGTTWRWMQIRGGPDPRPNDPHRLAGVHVDIDQRRRIERAEQRAREQADAARRWTDEVLRSIGDGVLVIDGRHRYAYLNPAAERLLGVNANDVLGKNIFDVFPGTRGGPFDHALREVQEKRVPVKVVELMGEVGKTFDARFYPTNVDEISVFFADVSDAVTAKRKSEEDNERLQNALDAGSMGLFEAVPGEEEVFCDTRVLELFGFPDADDARRINVNDVLERIHPLDRDRVAESFLATLREKGAATYNAEFRVKDADGNERWLVGVGRQTADEAGKVRRVVGVNYDITDRRRDTEQLAQQALALGRQREQLVENNRLLADANAALARTTAQLQALLANAPVGFAFFNREHRFLRVNRPLADINGVSADEHVGQRVEDIVPGVADDVAPLIDRVFQTGQPVVGAELQGQTRREPNARRWWLASYFPVLQGEVGQPDRRVEAVGGVFLEITDRKRTEQMLRVAKENAVHARVSADRARQAAERANRAKSEFLAVLSHELRTPLTPVLAATQMLEADLAADADGTLASVPEETRETLHDTFSLIRRNVELEVRLIDDLLDLTRITRGKLQLSRRPIDLNEAVRHALETCQAEVAESGLVLETEFAAGPLGATADPARVQQVVWNLVKNAVKFTPENGKILVRTYAAPPLPVSTVPRVACQVSDTGLGIDAEKLGTIFNAFEQGGRGMTRTFGGLGLGLTISRHLVQAHGGTLDAASEGPGRGATFTMTLPARAYKTPPALPPLPAEPVAAPRGRRILLVEDHADTAKLMSRFLRIRHDAEVRHAASVAAARKLYEEDGPFDLIISDIGLPDGSGTELLSSLPVNARPPAIALSGYGTDADHERSHAAGFVDHLVKPVDLDRLERTVRRTLATEHA
jgi:PAS domain S-box-containing protein